MSRVHWCNPMRGGLGAVVDPLTFLVGDSLAVGLGAPLTTEFGGATNFKYAAKGGTTVAQWLSGSQSGQLTEALKLAPKRVLVSLGTNDTNGKISAEAMKTQVAALVAKIKAVGAEPIWLMPGKLPWSADQLVAAVSSAQVRVIDPPADIVKSDQIHPTGDGYKAWAKKIYAELNTPAPSVSTGAKASIAPLALVAAIVGLAWWLT